MTEQPHPEAVAVTAVRTRADGAHDLARTMIEATTEFDLRELPLQLETRLALWALDFLEWAAQQPTGAPTPDFRVTAAAAAQAYADAVDRQAQRVVDEQDGRRAR